MKFINKALNQINGNQLVDAFLNDRWDNAISQYSNIGYTKLEFNQLLRDPLVQLLLREQNNYCCYCMRYIDTSSTTREHVVPISSRIQSELNQYAHYPIIRDNVCLQTVFDNATNQLNTPPYPLEIAYENLTASCNGVFPNGPTYHTCNHIRGNHFIEPMFYISTIEHEIIYRRAGLMDSSDISHIPSIRILNLNYSSLQKIRQVWYHISVENIQDIENADTELKRNEILTTNLIGLPPTRRIQLIADFKTETYWDVLLQYKWFYDYYRPLHNIV
jgi:hypothetical protein